MSYLPSAFRFTVFPKGHWRIVWVGEVKFIRNTHNVFQPVISVTLRSVPEPSKLTEVNVAVGQMVKLIIGSEYVDGVEQLIDFVHQREYFNLTTYQAKFIKAGSSLSESEDNAFWLPFAAHDQHKHHTESWCLLVTLDEVDLIIPCIEMLRFYFGSSSNLLKQIVRNYFTPKNLWQDHTFDEAAHLKITLAQGISGASAADIGRIIVSKVAHDAVAMVSKSISTSTANREKAYIKMPFPFIGKTKLQVVGQWLRIDGSKDRFVVNVIESCSHRMPYHSLNYVSHAKSINMLHPSSAQAQAGMHNPKTLKIQGQSKVDKLVNEEPNLSRQTRSLNVRSRVRFPDLLGKEVIRVTPARTDMILIGHSPSSGNGSTGDGYGNNNNTAKVDLCLDSPFESLGNKPLKSPVAAWERYFELLTELAHQSWIDDIEFLKLDSRQVERHYAQLPSFVDDNGEVVFDSLNPTNKHRRVSICRVKPNNGLAWFMVSFEPCSIDECCLYLFEPNTIISWMGIFELLPPNARVVDKSYQLAKIDILELIEHIKSLMCSILAT